MLSNVHSRIILLPSAGREGGLPDPGLPAPAAWHRFPNSPPAPYNRFCSLAHVSRSSAVRLKTSRSAVDDLSAQKYPRRSN